MLTRSGLGVVAATIALAFGGWWWHYEELVVLSAAALAAVVVALWSARVRQHLRIVRTLGSPRVARGDPVRAVYRATNPGRRRTAPIALVDSIDGHTVRVPVPAIGGHDRTEVSGLIPTRRRGVFTVGPWSVERIDPFGLAVGRRVSDVTSSIIVHPRIHRLGGPTGLMHTIEDESVVRRSASDPLSGFVSLREYVDGDDPRLIHWPTSARVGTLMLREHVELRRPEFTVVLDAVEWVATPDDFEEMVDVAASVSVHALRSGVSVRLRTTSRSHPGWPQPVQRDTAVLDLLTPVMQSGVGDTLALAEIFRHGIDHTMIVFVTGPSGPSTAFVHTDKLSVVRVGAGAAAEVGIALAAQDAEEFARRWRP